MPNLPEEEDEQHEQSPNINGHHRLNGHALPSDDDSWGEEDNEADIRLQLDGIVRLDEEVLINAEAFSNTETSEGSEDEEAQQEDGDVGEKAPFFGDNPVYLRRYQFVSGLLKNQQWTRDIKRLVDIGANNCEFLYRLRNNGGMRHLREVIALDVDESLLEWHRRKTEPLNVGNLLKDHMRRFYPLDVYHMAGSVAEKDDRLKNMDAVTAIELIEHLYPETLARFPLVVFGHMRPKLVVITTPNREFNVLFPNFEGPFRHWDHKFEFTRKEFRSWADAILDDYPDYNVSFDGVGEQPSNISSDEDLGFCTQIAIFVRKDFEIEAKNGSFANRERGSYLDPSTNLVEKHLGTIPEEDPNSQQLYPYKQVVHHRAEHMPDERSMELRCFHTLNTHIKELAAIDIEYYNKTEELLDPPKLDNTDVFNPKIYYHRIKDHLKEYCYDDYGDEYSELNDERKVGEIIGTYKDDFNVGYDVEEGVYFQVNEEYWNENFESSEDESGWDSFRGNYRDHSNRSDSESINVVGESETDCSFANQQHTSTDWSDSDHFEPLEPVVPPATLEEGEMWSDEE